MNKYIKLIKNSGLFALANMGSSLLSFLLVRFYTELLSAEEYGTIDFIATTVSILIPFLTVAIVEAVLRYSMDQSDKNAVLNNGLAITLAGNLAFFIIAPWFFINSEYSNYFLWIALLLFTTSVEGIFAQFIRGIGQVRTFAICGILKTGSLIGSNILLLLVYKFKVRGYLSSMIISELVGMLFLFFKGRLWKCISMRVHIPLLKQMLLYSLPLMPNSLSWWVMNASDKYMITAFLGLSANGLYAVAHKIPSLINICNGLFFQAWQLSAVEESNKKDTGDFYSSVFNMLAMFLILVATFIFLVLRPVLNILVASSYAEVWRYTPFLVLSMVFSAFSSFLGVNYVAMKKTNGALKTAIIGAVINLALNFTLIPRYGLNGASFATMCSMASMWIARAVDTRNFVVIRYQFKIFIPVLAVLVAEAILLSSGFENSVPFTFLCTTVIVLLYSSQLFRFVKAVYLTLRKGEK